MAVTIIAKTIAYQGLSSDAKPTAGVTAGATYRETDTGASYLYDGAAWQPQAVSVRATLLSLAITTALTAQVSAVQLGLAGMKYLIAQANFTYGSSGTTAKAWVQTSIDDGATWIDVMCFSFTTSSGIIVQAVTITTALAADTVPTDGTLAANTILSGLLGDRLRVKYTTTGTYAGGTTLALDICAKG
jgi:hypothetical protein